MAIINRVKLCNKHTFYDAVAHPSGCPICKQESNKDYDTNIRSKDRKKIYNSIKWKQVRELALLRDNLLCIPCLKKGIYSKADEVHHIIELKDDVTKAYDLDNLESICHKHHMEHHKGKAD